MALSRARRAGSGTEEQWTPLRNAGLLRSIGTDEHGMVLLHAFTITVIL